jgi:ribosomal protein S17
MNAVKNLIATRMNIILAVESSKKAEGYVVAIKRIETITVRVERDLRLGFYSFRVNESSKQHENISQ